jgi:hypothetical protein
VHYLSAQAYYQRAGMRLARGEAGAGEDAERALELAEAAHDPQVVYPTRIVAGYVFLTLGRTERARELLSTMAELEPGGLALPLGFGELAWLASDLDARERLLRALADVHPTPWVETARAIVSGEPLRAAVIYDRMRARPEAAYTRMRSGEPAEVERALAFYRSVGAARYIHECEQLLAATA